jgi:hypothetical protein
MVKIMFKFIKNLFKTTEKPKYLAEPDSKGTYYIVGRSKHSGEFANVLAVNVKDEDIDKTVQMLERNIIEIFVKERSE